MAEYVAKFEELAWYVAKMIAFDDTKKMKFIHGLRLDVVKQVGRREIGPRSYTEAVQRAIRISGWDASE